MATSETERSCWLHRVFERLRRWFQMARGRTVGSTGLKSDQHEVGIGIAPEPAHGTVVWQWNTKWMKVEDRGFINVETPSFQIDRVLVAVGIVDSRSNAQRLIKQNAITWRKDDGVMDWTKVTDFKQELEPGWPWVLRVGNGHWRTVQLEVKVEGEKPKTVPRSFPSLALVMRPEECQTRDLWSEMWK